MRYGSRPIFVPCFSRRGSEKKHGLSGCKKKVPPNSKMWVSIRTVLYYDPEPQKSEPRRVNNCVKMLPYANANRQYINVLGR